MLQVQTTRFGTVEIAEDRVLTFPKGLLGFSSLKRYCLLQPNEDAAFYWLQCLDDPSLAFVVTDPNLFFSDFSAPIRPEQMRELTLTKLEDAQVFVIVNKVNDNLTANLQGPLVVNVTNRIGEQLVLADKRWTTRHHMLSVGQPAQAASA
ncbi:MAG: flagellar assembly protein FliW [Phycisphaerales bacterium]|jgi:flagellar assembly factor FliW|nr:MAG: flagellar assembly protein FliW [Phycisphaerales bacterium]